MIVLRKSNTNNQDVRFELIQVSFSSADRKTNEAFKVYTFRFGEVFDFTDPITDKRDAIEVFDMMRGSLEVEWSKDKGQEHEAKKA
jgi:hypothetical protein